ncbi:SPOR domain-containing protein [Sulfurivermis fontis]|uniref:SPOR domain-containing protein n=1 Tax=Sulfurivermis fontis TaxID=1972068 RepID=UPI000FDBF9B5|nr:SPOR domain-containing protein [Sulfurivermis fontis]
MATRDYKKRPQAKRSPARKGGGAPGWLWLLAGLAVGLLVAFLIWLDKLPLPKPAPARTAVEKPAPAKAEQKDARSVMKETPPKAPDSQAKDERKLAYDFYTLLPEMEVPVPDNEPTARGLPPTPVAPGSYVVQVGAFRTMKDADARKAELALLGIVSSIQVITIDNNTLHRVRIGPIKDLARLDQVRNTLRQNDIPFMLLREKS